jgi:hypothetical protein
MQFYVFTLELKSCKKTTSLQVNFFFGPNIALFKKNKNLAVHIITDINYYENSTKAVN